MSALGSIVQQKSIAIEERPVWHLHWSAFSSQRKCVWKLNQSVSWKWRSGLNRIGHPDWVKLSVELNCAPNQKYEIFPFSTNLYKDIKYKVSQNRCNPLIYGRCPWCNVNLCPWCNGLRKWTLWHKFKSWTETDCISHSTNTLRKGMNPIILPPAMGK